MILAVIPARGGSKRLPGKNIMAFGGRPLLAWSVGVAKCVAAVGRCVVSTDDACIADVARAAGADVIERPAALAGDNTPTLDVLIHAAEAMRAQGMAFDGVMTLQPTNPLRPAAMVEQAIARFLAEPCDSLIAVSRRPFKLGRVVDGYFEPDYAFGTQSRLMPPVIYENGLLYLTKTATLLDRRSLTGDKVLAFETQRPFDEVDIDEAVDMVVGEAILAAVRDRLGY